MNTATQPLSSPIDAIARRVADYRRWSPWEPIPAAIVEACGRFTGHRRGEDGRCRVCTGILAADE